MLLTARRITSLFGRIVPYIEKKRRGNEGEREGWREGREGRRAVSILAYASLLYSIGLDLMLFFSI